MRLGERALGAARVLWTDRHGGISAGRYSSLNLGDHVGDSPPSVAENRRRVERAVASRLILLEEGGPEERSTPRPIVWLRQMHGSSVHIVASGSHPGDDAPAPVADAAITDRSGVGVAVLTADCVPLAISCDGAAGVAHAGWKGLTGGVVEATVAELRRIGGGRVRALIGPCVHAGRYEFGAADLELVADRLGPEVIGRTDEGAPALDLPAAARVVLSRPALRRPTSTMWASARPRRPTTSPTGATVSPGGRR
ncbi:MAG: polyphenol oxidase family protein [Acidimicrobiia bacterium]|nr:polyphenol oxidase family protein [Acidimicrobiia bacterium]